MPGAIDEVISSLKQQFRGDLLCPGDQRYEKARVTWNGMTAKMPALIARCADVADIQAAIRAATQSTVFPAVRCGGHSLAGYSTCDSGLVIDLSRMRKVSVDPDSRRARFEGGCLLGNIDMATQQHGLAFPAGVVSHTGASGLVLGGGFGWLTRYGGLSCDNVKSFTVVIPDGSVVRADARQNEDLFWALRGGGGNFGVVTEFEVKLHPVTTVVLGEGFCFEDEIPRLLRCWREFMPEAPERLKWNISLRVALDTAAFPTEVRGRAVLSETVLWVGSAEEGSKYIDDAFSLGKHTAVTKRVMSFLDLQTMADQEFPHGRRYYTKSGYFKSLDDGSIEQMVKSMAGIPSPMTQIELAYLGGAAQKVAAADTAFGDRTSPFVVNVLGNWSIPSEDTVNVGWVRELFETLRPAMTSGVYINFMSGDEENRVPEAYQERWERLVAVKSKYDPNNLLRLNQNIPPRKPEASSLTPGTAR